MTPPPNSQRDESDNRQCRACGGDGGHYEGCRGEVPMQMEIADLKAKLDAETALLGSVSEAQKKLLVTIGWLYDQFMADKDLKPSADKEAWIRKGQEVYKELVDEAHEQANENLNILIHVGRYVHWAEMHLIPHDCGHCANAIIESRKMLVTPSPSTAALKERLEFARKLVGALQQSPCPKCENGDGIDGHEGAGCYKREALSEAKRLGIGQ